MAKKVLIVEDEKFLSKALQIKLQKLEYETELAFDGDEGLAKTKETDFDLVILDLLMPVKDGWDYLEGLAATGKTPKVLVLSNLSQPEDIEKAKSKGATDFLIKADSSLTKVSEKVHEILG